MINAIPDIKKHAAYVQGEMKNYATHPYIYIYHATRTEMYIFKYIVFAQKRRKCDSRF